MKIIINLQILIFSCYLINAQHISLNNPHQKIDSIIVNAIEKRAFPGAVIYAAIKDSVLIFKAYGHHTYDSSRVTQKSDIFDLASITKVSAGTLAIMKMYEEGLLDLDEPLKKYLNEYKWNKRGKSTIRELLTHSGGWQSWIKFYKEIPNKYFANKKDSVFNYKIGSQNYVSMASEQYILKRIKRCNYDSKKPYVYSDLFSYWIPTLTKRLTNTDYIDYLNDNFYNELRLDSTLYNPTLKFGKEVIVPTEIDTFFRNEPIHGTVHDEGAILMRGVSGHAGLFSTAEDLSVLWRMMINDGKWNGREFLKPSTLSLFTAYQFPAKNNRRALGFDKPLLSFDPVLSSISAHSTNSSFGHTGFTGTMVWADPKYDLVFIILTNRVHPSRNPNLMSELNIRPLIHDIIYTDYLNVSTLK